MSKLLRFAQLLSLLGTIAIAGCSKPECVVHGEIFIVTKGAQSIKLGLVEVRAIAYDEMQPLIKQKLDSSQDGIPFSDLPASPLSTLTDGDGHFTLVLPPTKGAGI